MQWVVPNFSVNPNSYSPAIQFVIILALLVVLKGRSNWLGCILFITAFFLQAHLRKVFLLSGWTTAFSVFGWAWYPHDKWSIYSLLGRVRQVSVVIEMWGSCLIDCICGSSYSYSSLFSLQIRFLLSRRPNPLSSDIQSHSKLYTYNILHNLQIHHFKGHKRNVLPPGPTSLRLFFPMFFLVSFLFE